MIMMSKTMKIFKEIKSRGITMKQFFKKMWFYIYITCGKSWYYASLKFVRKSK